MTMNQHVGRVRITIGLFLDSLRLPPNTEVLNAKIDAGGDLELIVRHPDIPEIVGEGVSPLVFPLLNPQIGWSFAWTDRKQGAL